MAQNIADIKILEDADFKLFIGDPGTGKTVAACSYPGDVYVFNIDGRIRPIKAFYPKRTDIYYDTFGPYDFQECMTIARNMARTGSKYKTVVADMTSFCNMCLQFILHDRGDKGKEIKGVDMIGPEEIGFETRAAMDFLDQLRIIHKQGVNVIVTAHELIYTDTNKTTGEQIIVKSLVTAGRKVAALIPIFFDEVYHFFVETGSGDSFAAEKFKCNIKTTSGHHGKTAYRRIKSPFDWTDKNFYELFNEKLKEVDYHKNPGDPLLS